MDKKIISTGAFIGMLAIILGAFGAHALKKVLSIEQLSTFETGVRYQMYQGTVFTIHWSNDKPQSKNKKNYL